MKTLTNYTRHVLSEKRRLAKQRQTGYLSKRKICNMTPDELILNKELINIEIELRGIGMLFG